MTIALYRDDAYLAEAESKVVAISGGRGLIVDRAVFFPGGGGQPGDSGVVVVENGEVIAVTAIKGDQGEAVLVPDANVQLPSPGTIVVQQLDWTRRYRHMRIHSALHLLSVVVPLPVTGGQISAEKGRLDFDMPDPPKDKQAIEDALNRLVERDLRISDEWISDEELDARPDLVKTMSVKPPRGSGKVRLVRIQDGNEQVDLQPCGGTHVRSTGEIGMLRLGKVEKKSRMNRRINMHLTDA